MKLSQIHEARHHRQVNLDDPEGWVFTTSNAVSYNDYAVNFWASEDLGNTVWEMENGAPTTPTTLKKGINDVYHYGYDMLQTELDDYDRFEYTDREIIDTLEENFEILFEKYSKVFTDGVKGGNYRFFLVDEKSSKWDVFSLLALK